MCYRCNEHVQKTASVPPPPAPHNVFLRHVEYREFHRRGETKIRITKTPEAMYYHPLHIHVQSASSTNIKLADSVVEKWSDLKELLWQEFGVRFA